MSTALNTDARGEHWITVGSHRIKLDDQHIGAAHIGSISNQHGLSLSNKADLMRMHQAGQITTRRHLGHAIAKILTAKRPHEQDPAHKYITSEMKKDGWKANGLTAYWSHPSGATVMVSRTPDGQLRVRQHSPSGKQVFDEKFTKDTTAMAVGQLRAAGAVSLPPAHTPVHGPDSQHLGRASDILEHAAREYKKNDTPENAQAYKEASKLYSMAMGDEEDLSSRVLPPPVPNRETHPFVGQMLINGIHILLENLRGDYRTGIGANGKPWRTHMKAHYGEIANTRSTDKDAIDCYVMGWGASDKIYVVKQLHVNGDYIGAFDEPKCIFGCYDADSAKGFYLSQYDDPRFFGGITEISVIDFQALIRNSGKPIKLLP